MARRTVVFALVTVTCVAAQGCGPGYACTEIGGINGVGVEIPEALFVRSGDVVIRVCDDDGCASTKKILSPFPKDATAPAGRGAEASFDNLGRKFAPGHVVVTATLHGPHGQVVASRTQEVNLRRSYPNGKQCDGDGYVSGSLSLQPSDRR